MNGKNCLFSIAYLIAWVISIDMGKAQSQTDNTSSYSTQGAFFALSVADLDASIKWYTEKLDLKIVMQGPEQKSKFALAVLEGNGLIVELVQNTEALPLAVAAPSINQTHLIHGIYKVGIVVDDLNRVLAFLKRKEIEIVMGPFPTRPNKRSNVAIKDNSGNLIMFIGA